MTDELALRKDMDRAARAASLLENDMLKEAFAKLESDYMDYWRNQVALNDVAGRERLWQAVHTLGKVRAHLQSIVNDGKVAKAQIDALAQGGR